MNKKQKANNPKLKPLSPRRIRQVRPDFFKNETIADLSMTARIGFIGIWILCDKHGRFEWKPRTLKSDIFPHDNLDFEETLDELVKFNFVQKYNVDGNDYGQVVNWKIYQYIGPAESQMDAVYPEPSKTFSKVPSATSIETL